VVLRPYPVAIVRGPPSILFVAQDDVVELLIGKVPVLAAAARVDAQRFGAQRLRRRHVRQSHLIVLLAHRGIVLPDVSAIHGEVHQLQLALRQACLDLRQVLGLDTGQRAVPEVRRAQAVAVAHRLQIAETIHGTRSGHGIEGIRHQ